jgi:hypothetical protein
MTEQTTLHQLTVNQNQSDIVWDNIQHLILQIYVLQNI